METQLTREQLLAAAGFVTPALKAEVEQVIVATIERLQPLNEQPIEFPEIRYDLKGKVAGRANQHYIRVNVPLLYENKTEMLAQTIPHETCHVVAYQWYGAEGKGHGYMWTRLMLYLGLEPKRCHSYATKPAKQHKKPHLYSCDCGTEFWKSNLIHSRIQMGQQARYCKKCRGTLYYVRSTQ